MKTNSKLNKKNSGRGVSDVNALVRCTTIAVDYIFTKHARGRIKERFSHKSQSYLEVLKRCKIASMATLTAIKRECTNHEKLASPNSEMVYWYAKDKGEQLWRVFVTTPENTSKFIVITYLEIDYTKYT